MTETLKFILSLIAYVVNISCDLSYLYLSFVVALVMVGR